jgi:hypothetical protein
MRTDTRIEILINDGSVLLRTARKQHFCSGGHDGTRHIHCNTPIEPRETYIEYTGETTPYHSGKRFHLECAQQQGLIKLNAQREL